MNQKIILIHKIIFYIYHKNHLNYKKSDFLEFSSRINKLKLSLEVILLKNKKLSF